MAMQQRAVLTRGRVLTAAAEVFARTGFLAASMNDIVDAAGVTKGAVYFHFPSKEALAVAIVEEQFAQWPAMVEAVVGTRRTRWSASSRSPTRWVPGSETMCW